jgi:hypothetical protein
LGHISRVTPSFELLLSDTVMILQVANLHFVMITDCLDMKDGKLIDCLNQLFCGSVHRIKTL